MAGETLLNNRYELIAQQGSGGMSVIYKAVDRALGRTVAVKILRPSLTADASFLEKFKMEARSVANLSHPNIVTVHDVGSEGPTHYIVMELVDGQDLKKIIRAQGALSVERSLNIAIQICAGIGYAHRSGLVHADVKPQNVLVTGQDVVKVTDFGIAQALSDTQPQQRAEVVWGSPHYFAPEQARGDQPSPASDVYAIGIVLFEMLTGRLPYIRSSQQDLALAHIRDRVPLVTELRPEIPESLARIVYKVMSKEPQNRYRMADQLGHVLQDFRDRSRSNTVGNIQVPPPAPGPSQSVAPVPPASMPSAPLQNNPGIAPPQNRPPGVGFGSPQVPLSDPTVRYSPAPHAPQSYHPRQQPVNPAQPNYGSASSAPQPFEQRYMPAPPQNRPAGDSSGYYAAQYNSQPLADMEADEGVDIVTIALAFLAFIAVAGLVPLGLVVLSAYAG